MALELSSVAAASLFDEIDHNNEGALTISELQARLSDAGKAEQEVELLLQRMNLTGDAINKREFVVACSKSPVRRAPRMLTCYVCGTQHGLASLGIHQKQCIVKREKAQAVLPPEQRSMLPAAPGMSVPGPKASSAEVEAYNAAAQAVYNSTMPKCAKCGRTFETFDKLAKHTATCKAGNETDDAGGFDCMSGAVSDAGGRSGPRMLTCYVCGTQHGLASLGIHQKQCIVKREKAQAVLPPEQRSMLPAAPGMSVPGPKASSAEVEAYNAAAQAVYNSTMPKCAKCGRTFETFDKLAKHTATCKAGNETDDAGGFDCMSGAVSDAGGRSGPRMLTCYVCGTQHGLASLGIHQKQCIVKREKAQAVLPPEQRSMLPAAPGMSVPGPKASSAEVEAYNAAAQAVYNSTMPKCAKCGRTFETFDKLAKHTATCKAGNETDDAGGFDCMSGAVSDAGGRSGPRMLTCYVCGTQHGLASLGIHQKQCIVKREKAQAVLPPEQRSMLPAAPGMSVPGPKASSAEVEAYNAAAQAVYNSTMPKCAKCGRTFETFDKLAKHTATCKAGNETDDAGGFDCMSGAVSDAGGRSGPRMLTCYVCGTQHGLASLGIHQKQCIVKREKAQAVLPPEQRSMLPAAPGMSVPGPKASSAEVEAYNAAAQAVYNSTMPKCAKCGRTFETFDKLQAHRC